MIDTQKKILLDGIGEVSAIAPYIISVSRATDIPAFYMPWFIESLKRGFCLWQNPFNKKVSVITFENTRFAVFWSKNPQPLLSYIDDLKKYGLNFYIQYTLNDYEKERYEKLPTLHRRIETFIELSKRLGKDSVVWRFDPLILTDRIDISSLILRIDNIASKLNAYTNKLVISFADIDNYSHVKRNLKRHNVLYTPWTENLMQEFACELYGLIKRRGYSLEVATCAESIDFSSYGIAHNSCIDVDLIVKLAHDDKKLMDYLKVTFLPFDSNDPLNVFLDTDANLLYATDNTACKDVRNYKNSSDTKTGIDPYFKVLNTNTLYSVQSVKDSSQRKLCLCYKAKDIGAYNTCPNLCVYCYANKNENMVIRHYQSFCQNPHVPIIKSLI